MPGLEENEHKREREFYRDRGLSCPKDHIRWQEDNSKAGGEMIPDANMKMETRRFDDQVITLKIWVAQHFYWLMLMFPYNSRLLALKENTEHVV